MAYNTKYISIMARISYIIMVSYLFAGFTSGFLKFLPKSSLYYLFRQRKRGIVQATILFGPPAFQSQTWQLLARPVYKCALPTSSRRSVFTQSVPSRFNEEDEFETSKRLLFVGGITPEMNEDVVRGYFSSMADVESVKMVRNLGGAQKQFCFVKVKDVGCVDRILEMTHTMRGRQLLVLRTKKHRVVLATNLPSSLTAPQLKKHFANFGRVENVEIPEDRRMKQRKGYSLITFSSQDEAAKAVEQERHEIGSYILKVKFLGTHGEDMKTPKILLDNLPFETSVEDLKETFAKFGGLKIIDLAIRNDSNKCIAFLTFDNEEVVEKLVKMKDLVVGNSVVAMKKEIPSSMFGARLRSIHVGNLPAGVSKTELIDYFSTFGMVYKVVLPLDAESGNNKGFAVVKFHQRDAIQRVMAQLSHYLGSTQLTVRRFSLVISSNDNQH